MLNAQILIFLQLLQDSAEEIPAKIEEWNKNEQNETKCKLYEDPLLAEMTEDIQTSFTRKNLINSLKSIVTNIESAIDDLGSWNEEVISHLEEIE